MNIRNDASNLTFFGLLLEDRRRMTEVTSMLGFTVASFAFISLLEEKRIYE